MAKRPPSPAMLWLVGAAVASAAMLAIAHAFQTFGHMPPCELCLRQRAIYWAALVVAILGAAATRVRAGAAAPIATLIGLIFLFEAGVAAYHAGVEWKWWPGPASCTGTGAVVTAADLKSLMAGLRVSAPRCDQAPWRFVGLSMAGWNCLIAFMLAVVSFASVAASRTRPLRRSFR